MHTPLAKAVSAMAAIGVAAGCFTEPFGAPEPSSVTIRVSATGGIAATQYAFVVDGASGVVRGIECSGLCGFEAGDVILGISSFQIADIAAALEDAGILGYDGADFGVACCDDFLYQIEYDNGDRRSVVRGTGFRFPDPLRPGLHRLVGLAAGWLPAVVKFSETPAGWPQDGLQIDSFDIDGPVLTMDLSYGGGCREHSVDFVAWNGWLESFPVQVGAILAHDARDDACDALIHTTRTFDLTPLRRAYEASYGTGSATIVIRLRDGTGRLHTIPFSF
jgi:hypothetical protein